jgi:Asp/Glu/hydantoin racemase
MSPGPRIVLIHALRDSMVPIWNEFEQSWPEAKTFNLLDDSLSEDLADEGALTQAIVDRFLNLGRYARAAGPDGQKTDAILFTCSAFGPAIDQVKQDLDVPVLSPNEAAFEVALKADGPVGLLVTFPPSEASLSAELRRAAAAQKHDLVLKTGVAVGALAALQAGREEEHDALIAGAARELGDVSCIVLGQFSMARAYRSVEQATQRRVITTPAAAVSRLRQILN